MFQLKRITPESVPRALAKAERYRLLNEPEEAESICEDILVIEPENQQALFILLLAVTDTFHHGSAEALNRSRALLPRLREPYDRTYYEGIICERWAKAQYNTQRPSPFVHGVLREAMQLYEKADEMSPPENDDAVLRWNACARFITNSPDLRADVENLNSEAGFGDEVPPR
jgi:hypothetical protein